MTPNTNHDDEINVYCDYLTDNNIDSDEIRFEDAQYNNWVYELGPDWLELLGRVGTRIDGTSVGDYITSVGVDDFLLFGDVVGG